MLRPKFLQPLAGAARTRRGWGACEFKSVSSCTPPWFASLPRQQSQGVIYPQMGSCRYSLLTLHGPVRLSPVSSPRLQVHPAKVLRGKEEPLAQEPASRTDLRTAVSWRTLNASPAPGSFPCSLTSRDPHSRDCSCTAGSRGRRCGCHPTEGGSSRSASACHHRPHRPHRTRIPWSNPGSLEAGQRGGGEEEAAHLTRFLEVMRGALTAAPIRELPVIKMPLCCCWFHPPPPPQPRHNSVYR